MQKNTVKLVNHGEENGGKDGVTPGNPRGKPGVYRDMENNHKFDIFER